jgi:transcriptional regulator with XRE-family HTH domain
MNMLFKVTLRAARINRGFTLKEVAEKTGKCIDTISKYEADSSSIPHEFMVMLLELYQVPFGHVFFGKESEFHGFPMGKEESLYHAQT